MHSHDIATRILEIGARARAATRELVRLDSDQKNAILRAMATEMRGVKEEIVTANECDLERQHHRELSPAMIDRLRLGPERVEAIAAAIEDVAALPDPVGEVLAEWTRPNGLCMRKVRVPIGVIGIIYESRPNVTSDAAALCFKAGNATILRGGSEAFSSNTAISRALQQGGERAGLPPNSIQLIPFTDREGVDHLARMDKYLDLIIPRGGQALIERVVAAARVPVLKHYQGICHIYVHEAADFEMAGRILIDGKCPKPGVCNAVETLLVDEAIARAFYPAMAGLLEPYGVKIRGDETVLEYWPGSTAATEKDWETEYLDLILSVRTVAGSDAAIAHINSHGSHHTDVVVTGRKDMADKFFHEVDSAVVLWNASTRFNDGGEFGFGADKFFHEVDSAVVLWNASTRFNDGGEFGFGAEIGISTDKLHARGPMGLPELCSYKYLVTGAGHVRSESVAESSRSGMWR